MMLLNILPQQDKNNNAINVMTTDKTFTQDNPTSIVVIIVIQPLLAEEGDRLGE